MPRRSSDKKAAAKKDAIEEASLTPDDAQKESSLQVEKDAVENCSDDVDKGAAVVDNMMAAAAAPRLLPNCKCMLRRGKFYCYKLVQGRWTQASAVGYPNKEICEANNCMA